MSDASTRAHQLETEELLREVRDRLPAAPIMEYSRSAFMALAAHDQMAAVKRGARVVNDPPAGPRALPEGGIRRADFDKLSPPERHRFIAGGKAIVD